MNTKIWGAVFFIAMFFLLAAVVMYLWNTILPGITNLTVITYWQALGLMVLSRILFGRFNFGGRNKFGGPKAALKEKTLGMTEHDREIFKQEWRKRCEDWRKY